jgi:Ring finger domain/SWIM zinc finger
MPKTTKVTNSDESAPAKKKKASPTKENEEKRAKLYRKTCPIGLQERLERAATQRLYLVQQSKISPMYKEGEKCVDFTVLGSTGNVYTVVLGLEPSCTCPDYYRRKDMCKHIMFVLLKVIGLDVSNPLAYQKAYISSELDELYTILRTRRVGGTILANDQVRAAVAASQGSSSDVSSVASVVPSSVQRRSLLDDSDCPICFDDLTNEPESKVTFCRGTCGANFHLACISRWLTAMTLSKPSCPHCRQLWVGENGSKGTTKIPAESTYTNLGSLQGLSHVRDSSTYTSYGKKRRK